MHLTTCLKCKNPILSKAKRKFCSKKCREQYEKIKNKKRKCLVCDKIFKTRLIKQKYCSRKCSIKIQNQQVKRWYEGIKKLTYFVIFERDNFKCIYCGKSPIEDGIKLVVDHVYPRKRGGKNDIFNLITCCKKCNGIKHAKTMKTEVIYRIWKKNSQLSINFPENENYDDLVLRFNKLWKHRTL